jgi:prevent-host-death family protein
VTTVNILEAKTSLSKLVAAVESGETAEIVIARNGKPVARLVPIETRPPIRLGLLKGKYRSPRTLDDVNPAVRKLFEQGE